MSSVHVDFRKWPDQPYWHFDVEPLGQDEFGLWYGVPAGSALQRGEEAPIVHPAHSVMLVRESQWWAAFWNSDRESRHALYIDVATPPRWLEDRIRMVDLDLDVSRDWEGRTSLLDADEFEAHQRAYEYPGAVIAGAREAGEWLLAAVGERREPFARIGEAWLARMGS